mgnify:FL=1
MELTLDGSTVRGGRQARERFYDSRGYGRVVDGNLALAPVEAAHILYRGDIEAIRDADSGDRLDFRDLLSSDLVSEIDVLVYKDLRDRGFYLSPTDETDVDFLVYPRGDGPWDDTVAYRVRAVGERTDVPTRSLGEVVLAVVDEESSITYLDTERPDIDGSTRVDLPHGVPGDLLEERVLVWDPPTALYERGFYGQPLGEDGIPLQLSLLEAAFLAARNVLALDERVLLERGREVEGERFDRRLAVYRSLRNRDVVPKTGYKFGADFRTYADVEHVDELTHSELLVRVLPSDHSFSPRDLALAVRLAHGVRKRMVFGLVGDDVEWLSVTRLTP